MRHQVRLVCACSALAIIATPVMAGPDWLEQGDAGSTLDTAQKTFGVGDLNTISGSLSVATSLGGIDDFEDMYLISVHDPANFSMSVSAAFNAQLWVFNVTLADQAFGLLGSQNPTIGPLATDGTGAALTSPGIYAIAVSGLGRVPTSMNGEIFFFADPNEISGPDGPGGLNPHIDWTGVGEVGSYVINLTGTGFFDVPAPGGIALIALFAPLIRRRSRVR